MESDDETRMRALLPGQADFEALGARTEGFSGSDVNVVVKDVLMEPVRKTQEATHFRRAAC
jgi:vacuolar protein-sorting-associated protein 4